MGKETQLLEASAAGNLSKVQQLLENRSRLRRILSTEKLFDQPDDELEQSDAPTSLTITNKKMVSHMDINFKDENGSSSLMLATLNGHRDVVHMLLLYSANIHTVDNQGNTALHFAAWHNRSDIVELLLANEAKADSVNKEGSTPLHYACQYCPPGKTFTIVKLLQGSDKSILRANKAGDTPFSLAVRFNKQEAVSLLIDADPKTLKETKCIIEASKNGKRDVVETLLDAGMDPNCFDGVSGSCPLHEAVRFFRKETARILLEFGASCDQISANGETAISITKQHPDAKREEFYQLFLSFKDISPRIPTAMIEKASVKTEKDAEVYITYPLLKNKPEWTKADGQFCSAWTKQHPNTYLLDDDRTTYWKIPTAAGTYNWVAFDLGSEYTMTGVRLAGWSMKEMVHTFIVQVAKSLSGPWTQVGKYKADYIGPEDLEEPSESQDFRGFYETSRYWKLVIADNYGAPTTCLAEVQFFGVEVGIVNWFEGLKMKSLLKGFVQKGYNQLSELALITRFDVEDLGLSSEEEKQLLHAVSVLREKHYPPKNLVWAVKPPAKVTANNVIRDFVVQSDLNTLGDLKLVVRGGAILGGQTLQPLISRQKGFPPKCTFKGITIGPAGQYTLEIRSTVDSSVLLKSDPLVVNPPAMRQSEIGQVFDDLDKLLQF